MSTHITAIGICLTSFLFFLLGQENPVPKPLSDTATIACPFGSEFSFSRGSDATLTVKCVPK